MTQSALSDPHPVVAMRALNGLQRLAAVGERQRLLQFALLHKHSGVRQAAIRMYVAEGGAGVNEVLRAALFDRSRGVRRLAAYELERVSGESALPFWRESAVSSSRRKSEIAILALCEMGAREDVEGLIQGAQGRNAGVRASVLRGLGRVGFDSLVIHLSFALTDGCKEVVNAAVEIYRRGSFRLDPSALEGAIGSAKPGAKARLMRAAHVLGKWNALVFLLRQVASEDHRAAELATAEIDRWVQRANRRFTQASASQASEVTALLSAARLRQPGRDWRALEQAVRATL